MTRPYQTAPNGRLCICGAHAFACTSRWGVVLVSPPRLALLAGYTWALLTPKPGYAYARSVRVAKETGGAGTLHRAVFPGSRLVDHKNGNGLDCQDDNLRPATYSQNRHSAQRASRTKSGFRGVYPNSSGKGPPWKAAIKVSGGSKHLGYFADAADGARAFDAAAVVAFGEFARVNFPHG